MQEGQLRFDLLLAKDPSAVKTFLEKHFGFEFDKQDTPNGGSLFTTPGGRRGGVLAVPPEQVPSVVPYIHVKDIRRTQKMLQQAGAQIVLPPSAVPKACWQLYWRIEGGPVIACWQDDPDAA